MGRGSRPQLLWLAALSALITVGISVIVPAASGELPASTPPPWRSVSASEGADRIERLAKGHPKLESVLSQLAAAQREGGLAQAARLARSQGLTLKGDAVRVVVEARSGKVASAVRAVEAQGGRVETTYKDLVQALVPLPALEPLADLEAVRWVRRPWQPQPAVVSEGVGIINAPAWQVAGYRGQGVKVAILDGGFQGYAALQGTELPSNPVTQSFTADGCIACGTPHGTACAEIVYDIAPHAQYYFVTAHTDVEFGNAVSYLVDQEGVDIVSHSANWSVAGPGDGSGYLADLINHAQSQGVLWVNSAGNFADMHWEGAWRDDNGNDLHDWIPGDEGQTIYLEAGEEIQVGLRWDDPWGASGNDYDLLLCTGGCDGDALKACGCDTQDGDDDPVEFISYRATESGNYWIAVEKYRANRNVHFEIYSYYHPLEYPIASSSLGIPADAAGALAVGAIHWNSLGLEPFSSQGPTNDGRTKPDLVAPDGVSTQSYGPSDGRPWASRGTGFFGTSASAPHVAGAAALVKSAYPSYGPAQIRNLLEGRAIDMGSGGQDNLYGWGRLTLGQAPTGTATPTPTVTRTPGPPTATPGAFKNQLPLIMKVWPPIPDVPVLHEISNPDGDGNYTVSWGAAARATSYTLEEDDNALFSSPTVVYSGVETSTVITGKAMGTYYYRVRATNSYGHSAWSAPQAVTVMPPTPTPT
ncbi:MAG: S8 family serine peptidase, partial [Anaerolineae bacterium]